jgi:hypothetical protein
VNTTPYAIEAGPDRKALGAVCSSHDGCQSDLCLLVPPNLQNAPGQCSADCSSNQDCGGIGTCLTKQGTIDGGRSALDGGACYRTCSSASDCLDGIPCVWQAPLDAGLCQTLGLACNGSTCAQRARLCDQIAASDAGTACEACLGAKCCDEVVACASDVTCAKAETCAGTCSSSWQSSGSAAAQAVAACANKSCAAECQ